MVAIAEKYAYADALSSSPPPSSPAASDKDLFGPMSSPPRASHSTPSKSRPNQERLYSGIQESSNPHNPTSAFYEHPRTRLSLQQANPSQRLDLDLEAGLIPAVSEKEPKTQVLSSYSSRSHLTGSSRSPSLAEIDTKNLSKTTSPSDLQIWPTKQELEQRERAAKKVECRRKWNFIGALPKKQKLYAKLFIGVVVIAAAIGIGVGISRAVHGGVYTKDGGQQSIPS